jgi:hypothetical protein
LVLPAPARRQHLLQLEHRVAEGRMIHRPTHRSTEGTQQGPSEDRGGAQA